MIYCIKKAASYNEEDIQKKTSRTKGCIQLPQCTDRLRNEKNTFGYIKIPKMKQKLPLYLGATMENMRKRTEQRSWDRHPCQ